MMMGGTHSHSIIQGCLAYNRQDWYGIKNRAKDYTHLRGKKKSDYEIDCVSIAPSRETSWYSPSNTTRLVVAEVMVLRRGIGAHQNLRSDQVTIGGP